MDLVLAFVAGGLTTAWTLALATVIRNSPRESDSER